jgi:hypothetical protein
VVSDPSILPDLSITWLSPITELQTTPKPFDITPQTQIRNLSGRLTIRDPLLLSREVGGPKRPIDTVPYPLKVLGRLENPKSIPSSLLLSLHFPNKHLSTLHSLRTLYPSMSASALLKSRVARPSYLKKLAKAEDLIEHFPHGSWIVSQLKNSTLA